MLNDVRCGHLIKVIWHDGQGMCLFAKRLERGRFIWPSPADGVVAISAGQMGYLLEGIVLSSSAFHSRILLTKSGVFSATGPSAPSRTISTASCTTRPWRECP
jgi:IS66 Orf2 like protein